jgi:dTDP-4-amino-4,6-dideoxygalactose transaminase
MKVPLLDPSLSNLPYMDELVFAATQVLKGGQYILGKEVNAFEKVFAHYFDVPHAIGVSSGTDALIASLLALGIGPGDEVICPSFTFFATAGAIHRVGAKPVFVDIMPDCFTIDPVCIESAITMNTKAIIPVHLFGQSADLDSVTRIASDNGLYVIEDACQAIGCEFDCQKVGTFGDTGVFL